MKKLSIRPVLTVTAAACLLPAAAVHAQTTLQSPPGGLLGESAAQPAGQSAATPMTTDMVVPMAVPMSPAQALSQPYSPVYSGDQREGLQFRALAGVEHDDNVLRTATGQISDTITGLGLGLRYQKRISQQRIVLDAEVDRYHYDNINGGYTTFNYSAAWNFKLGERIDGIASADRRQFRDVTSNGVVAGINRRTERNELVEGGYKLGAAWRVLAGVQHQASRSTDPSAWDANLEQTSGRIGGSYEFASGSLFALRYRHGSGDYNNSPIVTGFNDDEIEGTMHWVVSPKTTVDARLAHLRREHDGVGAGAFDFSGMTGSLGVNWGITAKTSLAAGYVRDLGSYVFGTGGHLESDRWYVGPTWRATELIAVNLRYEHENRKFVDITGSGDVGRRDKFDVANIGVDWAIRRSINLGAQYRYEKRSSSLPAFNYRANVIGLTAKLTI